MNIAWLETPFAGDSTASDAALVISQAEIDVGFNSPQFISLAWGDIRIVRCEVTVRETWRDTP
jgi:hypothetical protein